MTIQIARFILDPLETNTYLITNKDSHEAIIVDPAEGSRKILEHCKEEGYVISEIWLTHAHFDHINGIPEIISQRNVPVRLHPKELSLYQAKGGAAMFGFSVGDLPNPRPDILQDTRLVIGNTSIKVFHIPGHTPGHIVFYIKDEGIVICGDVIFFHGIGRTDLPGGDYESLILNINRYLLNLPPETRLLSGHGPETTVEEEKFSNLFL